MSLRDAARPGHAALVSLLTFDHTLALLVEIRRQVAAQAIKRWAAEDAAAARSSNTEETP